tara:strand:+ start:551 stop:727 length:177 start_codon:yes stop_codon:yes gene_type:complete
LFFTNSTFENKKETGNQNKLVSILASAIVDIRKAHADSDEEGYEDELDGDDWSDDELV